MKGFELRKYTCCFTGHRDLPKERIPEIKECTKREIRALICSHGVRYFGVGGVLGYDTLAAKVLFRLREEEFPHIKVIQVYPFDGFTSRWRAEQIAEHHRMLPKYDKIVCIANKPGRDAYLARNRHLVDGSADCISYCARNDGGTAYTVRHAREQGLEVREISSQTTPCVLVCP